jgi:predicted HTH domain antitoxin
VPLVVDTQHCSVGKSGYERNFRHRFAQSVHLTENGLKMVLAAKLFSMGELSSGQAAKLVGITRREFLESAGKYGASIFQFGADE